MKTAICLFCSLLVMLPICGGSVADFPKVSEKAHTDWFPLGEATICTDAGDMTTDVESLGIIHTNALHTKIETSYTWKDNSLPLGKSLLQDVL